MSEELTDSIRCNDPQDEEVLNEPFCKELCAAEKVDNKQTTTSDMLLCKVKKIEQQITALLVSDAYAELMLKPTAHPVFQNKFVAFLQGMHRYTI